MLEKYNKLLNEISKEHKRNQSSGNKKEKKERYLLVDGLNLFIRGYTANPTTNDDGIHIGGIVGSLMSLGYVIKTYRPSRVIIAIDGKGGSQRRKELFPEYKANRKKKKGGKKKKYNRKFDYNSEEIEKKMMEFQLNRLMEYLNCLPITIIKDVDYVEADDIIAHIATNNSNKNVSYIIMSSDKDFLQLCSDSIRVYSPTKKILYNERKVKKEFNVAAKNLVLYRAMDGDKSDGIPGIKGWGQKRILKNIPCLTDTDHIYDLDELIKYAKENDVTRLIENKDLVKRNYKLMQLSDVNISQSTKDKINKHINQSRLNRLVKYTFQKMVLEDKLFTAIKNSTVWLSTTFFQLDVNAKKYNASLTCDRKEKKKKGE